MCVFLMDDGFICKPSLLASPPHANEGERERERDGERGRVTLARPDKTCRAAHEIFRVCACGLAHTHPHTHMHAESSAS